MESLLEDFTELIRLSEELPETYEWLRKKAHSGEIPAKRGQNGRIYIERVFALALAQYRSEFDSFNSTLQTVSAMSTASDTADDAVSTSVPTLSEEWNISERRIKTAASNLSNVAESNGAIECSEEALIDLRRRLSNQFS